MKYDLKVHRRSKKALVAKFSLAYLFINRVEKNFYEYKH